MDKSYILEEIKRTAAENGGKPLGSQRFRSVTGIKPSDWYGKYWNRWSDAVREVGYAANEFSKAHDKGDLLQKYAKLALELGRIPLDGDLRMKSRRDPDFPSNKALRLGIGTKPERVQLLMNYSRERAEYNALLPLCEQYIASKLQPTKTNGDVTDESAGECGFVYLIKSGRRYKIGRSNSAGRREYELAIQLPEKPKTIHTIRTDDPPGIEAYWHNRFRDKRKNGEWFELSGADVAAFKRRRFM